MVVFVSYLVDTEQQTIVDEVSMFKKKILIITSVNKKKSNYWPQGDYSDDINRDHGFVLLQIKAETFNVITR